MDDEVGILLSQINTEIGILIKKASDESELNPAHDAIVETAVKVNDLIREYANKVK